ncbi:MAG TPA: hypothetical protein VJ865_01050 [Gemmatimonadaceae bacterium]|nr:hypothetical protein [Gemmatimonadaceae bacterium]
MILACTDNDRSNFFRAIEGDGARVDRSTMSYNGNDVGEHTQPASGVVGTSSACYPSHRAEIKFN